MRSVSASVHLLSAALDEKPVEETLVSHLQMLPPNVRTARQ